jgi:hypothetical protein
MSTVEDYQKQREQRRKDFEQLLKSIAEALTGNWTVEEGENTDGEAIWEEGTPYRLWIWRPYQVSRQTRIEISGLFRVDGQWVGNHVRDRPKAITVSVKRTPAAIAKEIERRLLPAYKSKMSEAIVSYTNAKTRKAKGQETAERLAAVIGGAVGTNNHRGEHVFHVWHYKNPRGVSVTGTVNEFNENVSLVLGELTEEQATAVLRLFYPEVSNV